VATIMLLHHHAGLFPSSKACVTHSPLGLSAPSLNAEKTHLLRRSKNRPIGSVQFLQEQICLRPVRLRFRFEVIM